MPTEASITQEILRTMGGVREKLGEITATQREHSKRFDEIHRRLDVHAEKSREIEVKVGKFETAHEMAHEAGHVAGRRAGGKWAAGGVFGGLGLIEAVRYAVAMFKE